MDTSQAIVTAPGSVAAPGPAGRSRRSRRLRRVLLAAALGLALLCGGGALGARALWQGLVVSTAGQVEFARPLAVPPLAPSTLDAAGRRVFDLRAAPGRHSFGDVKVPTWGFGGGYLGPTLRASRGEHVVVNVRNDLPEATTVHWHGMHLPARMDGGPHQLVPPAGTWSPTWRVDQPAATLWYHPHPHGRTATHVYRGLAGLFIVDDPGTDAAALPRRYGVDDIPLIVQDKRLDGDRLDEGDSALGDVGVLGDTIAVNGTVGPYLSVTTELVRLRLLNASNARAYEFGFADDRRFALVGTDGGLLAAPHETTRVPLAAGERAEIVVAMRPGERTVLRSYPQRLGLGAIGERFVGGHDTLDLLQLRAAPRLATSPPLPQRLAPAPALDASSAATTRQFRLAGSSINGRRMDAGRVDATVVRDTTEVWRVVNTDGTPHSFHVHDVQFQVRSVGGQPPPPHLRGWKDTVYLRPQEPVELVLRFTDYSDPNTPYMFHCHVLLHEDRGMMGQFVVVEPGQAGPGSAPGPHGGGSGQHGGGSGHHAEHD